MNNDYSYFDEVYFQRGDLRGTVYRDYLRSSKSNPIYKEIAEAIAFVFRPRKVLEVGCATGLIVRYLNENGVEAYGIDVSKWATQHAEHKNVILCSADSIPFPDDNFDLVFSCHSLEHIPNVALDPSMREMTRVSSRFNFHMMPMVGVRPYVNQNSIEGLRKDPTHHQLHDYDWWVNVFEKHGNSVLSAFIAFKYDNAGFELTHGQLITKKNSCMHYDDILSRSVDWNKDSYERRIDCVNLQGSVSFGGFPLTHKKLLSYEKTMWKDLVSKFKGCYDIRDRTINVLILLEGEPCTLRLCFARAMGDDEFANVREQIFNVNKSVNWYKFKGTELALLRGKDDLTQFDQMRLGGECSTGTRIEAFVSDDLGDTLL